VTQSRFHKVIGAIAAGSLFVTSTGGAAATTALPSVPQVSPWATLAGLSGGAPAAALCGGAAAVAQAPAPGCVLPVVDTPPPIAQNPPPPPVPVPPIEGPAAGLGINPLYLALAAVAAGAGLYFLLKKKDNASSPG
jgi:hypothetical protein